jgi:hypothetical protein
VRACADGPDAFWNAVESEPGFDAAEFAAMARAHRVLVWLAPALADERAAKMFASETLAAAEAGREAVRQRHADIAQATPDILASFAACEIDVMFLRGLLLAERFFDEPLRRQQYDLDILVRPEQFEAAVVAMARAGFETGVDLSSRQPMEQRLARIRMPRWLKTPPHAVEVKRGNLHVDIHWCLRVRGVRRESPELWGARVQTRMAGSTVDTLCDEQMLAFLLLSACNDLKRGAARIKHFLDIYLVLRELEPQIDWEVFLEGRRPEGLLGVSVNVLAILLCVWGCGAEFPRLAEALERRRWMIELDDEAEAVALLERPRGDPKNVVWRRRVHPRSRLRALAAKATLDLPRVLARLRADGQFSGRLA